MFDIKSWYHSLDFDVYIFYCMLPDLINLKLHFNFLGLLVQAMIFLLIIAYLNIPEKS
jgi:hypothetical protein